MQNHAFLELKGLSKRFHDFTALHPIDLNVSEGEFLTIVGPSGSGKTTLIKLLVGMEEQSAGTISLRGKRLDTLPANQRPTCMVFQSLALFPHRSVGQNIEFPLKIKGVDANARKKRAEELLKLFRLPLDFYNKRISECSGGERQRIALARALAFDPEILFFDEPLSALDYRLRKTLEKELKALHIRTGKTFVYITHSLEEAMVMSDRIAILRAGKFEQIGPAHDIYARPNNRFVAEFMGDVNLFDFQVNPDSQRLQIDGINRTNIQPTDIINPAGTGNLLMVRPEKIEFLKPEESADFEIDGEISAEYMLGSRTQYEIRSSSGKLISVEHSSVTGHQREASSQPTQVRLGFAIDHCHTIAESAT
ncbi:MAG: ABC transporter ATP-binding protein [Granulosicoccus sp.]